jgi:hypothetical protein
MIKIAWLIVCKFDKFKRSTPTVFDKCMYKKHANSVLLLSKGSGIVSVRTVRNCKIRPEISVPLVNLQKKRGITLFSHVLFAIGVSKI